MVHKLIIRLVKTIDRGSLISSKNKIKHEVTKSQNIEIQQLKSLCLCAIAFEYCFLDNHLTPKLIILPYNPKGTDKTISKFIKLNYHHRHSLMS